jgi:hypothetical protein
MILEVEFAAYAISTTGQFRSRGQRQREGSVILTKNPPTRRKASSFWKFEDSILRQ